MNRPDRTSAGRRCGVRPLAWMLLTLGCALAPASQAAAQGVRGWGGTTVQLIELRPLGLDTIPRSDVTFSADGRATYQGRSVACPVGDFCTGYRVLPKVTAASVSQDVGLTAWGFGVRGLSFTTLLRVRDDLGSDFVWPRSGDDFDALLGYLQLVQGPLRVRAGRQEVRSGLGFPAFDGGSAILTFGDVRVEGYGGRSMARGLREPANEALRGIEAFLPDQSVYLIGAAAGWRIPRASVTGRYHREILADRSGLASERASVDFSGVVARARVTGSVDYDAGFSRFGKSHLSVSLPVAEGKLLLEGTARRYVPYFDLSTIWGFFEPVSYSEVEARVGWSPTRSLGAWVSGGRRNYADAGTTEIIELMTDDGWRANAGVRWQMAEAWQVDGSYRLEWGPGGYLSSGDASATFRPSDRLSLTATGMTFQQVEEFRLGDGRAVGGGLSFDVGLLQRARLAGGVSMLRHRGDEEDVLQSPWNQTRAWTGLRIEVGDDPGLAARRRR